MMTDREEYKSRSRLSLRMQTEGNIIDDEVGHTSRSRQMRRTQTENHLVL